MTVESARKYIRSDNYFPNYPRETIRGDVSIFSGTIGTTPGRVSSRRGGRVPQPIADGILSPSQQLCPDCPRSDHVLPCRRAKASMAGERIKCIYIIYTVCVREGAPCHTVPIVSSWCDVLGVRQSACLFDRLTFVS